MAKIQIYTTSNCVYCKMAKAWFKENKVEYEEINLEGNSEKQREMIEKSGQMGVPVIDIDGQIIIGFDKEAIKQALGM